MRGRRRGRRAGPGDGDARNAGPGGDEDEEGGSASSASSIASLASLDSPALDSPVRSGLDKSSSFASAHRENRDAFDDTSHDAAEDGFRITDSGAPGAKKARRFAILTLCDAAAGYICAASAANKRRYADLHGYDLIVSRTVADPSRPAAWSKILEVRKHLPRYDWLMFIDVDTLIMNPAVRLEDVADDSVDQVLAADHNGVNSGVWMVRNTPWSFTFLDELWAQDDLVKGPYLPLRAARVPPAVPHRPLVEAAVDKNAPYAGAAEVRAHSKIVNQCVFNSLLPWYVSGDFVVHFAGLKGVWECFIFFSYFDASQEMPGMRVSDEQWARELGAADVQLQLRADQAVHAGGQDVVPIDRRHGIIIKRFLVLVVVLSCTCHAATRYALRKRGEAHWRSRRAPTCVLPARIWGWKRLERRRRVRVVPCSAAGPVGARCSSFALCVRVHFLLRGAGPRIALDSGAKIRRRRVLLSSRRPRWPSDLVQLPRVAARHFS